MCQNVETQNGLGVWQPRWVFGSMVWRWEYVKRSAGLSKLRHLALKTKRILQRPCRNSEFKARWLKDIERHWQILKRVWVNTYRYIFSGMNIHLPAILGFTRYQGFDPSPKMLKEIESMLSAAFGGESFDSLQPQICLCLSLLHWILNCGDLMDLDPTGTSPFGLSGQCVIQNLNAQETSGKYTAWVFTHIHALSSGW